ncbi:MAG: cyclase family protein, partial [Deltaproteobacteria bacterium]|nr:cyclase family protein [Deltaproteobacteria bacterium]
LYDATLTIRARMVTFPGDPPFGIEPLFRIKGGAPFNLSLMSMGTHLGTHVDPPVHYLDGGYTADRIPLEILVGPGIVLDMRGREKVDRQALESADTGHHTRILLKTDNNVKLLEDTFHEDYVHLTEDGAEFLVGQGVCLVGIDYLSIERYMNPGAPVHRTLLSRGVLIVEGVNLAEVPSGPCEIYCLPLKILDGDGAPCRVLVRA